MKKLSSLLLAFALAACSGSGNQEAGSQDSTTLEDSIVSESFTEASEPVSTNDTSQLEITLDETAGLVFEKMEPVYTVSITTSQYEASVDVTWYFEIADISPLYFKQTWSAEGNEGTDEYFIEDGEVKCAYSDDGYTAEKWCRSTGGIRTKIDDESGNTIKELMGEEYSATANQELQRFLDILKAILKEAEIKEENENSLTLRIEKVVEVGMDVTESSEVTIPRKVYEALK